MATDIKRHVFTFWYNSIKLKKKEKKQLKKQNEKEKGKSTRFLEKKKPIIPKHTHTHILTMIAVLGSGQWKALTLSCCSISVTRIQS